MNKEIKKIISDLVEFKSVPDNSEEKKKSLKYCRDYFISNEIKIKDYEDKDNPAFIAELPGEKAETFLFMAHLDVVPGDDSLFKVKSKGDKLFGRGVLDNKGPAAMFMDLAKKIKNKKERLTVKILFSTDEESGGEDGAGRIMRSGDLDDVNYLFVPDGGEVDKITVKEKGVLQIYLQVKGRSAHGSRPWQGDNAINKAYDIFLEIENIFKNDKIKAKNKWYSTVNLGYMRGGEAANQVPDLCEMKVDIRFTEKYKSEELEKKIKKIIKNKAEIKKITKGQALSGKKDYPIIKKYIDIYKNKTGIKRIKFLNAHGASDARFFNDFNIPVWLQYPEGGDHHSKDEWVSLKSLEQMGDALEELLFSL
jgi:succinyl-diaminopimelate desuccinylase